jgi:cytochrome P450
MTAQKIPCVREPALIGSVTAFNGNRLEFLSRVARECGDIGSFHMGPLPVLLLNSPTFFQGVLVDHADAFDKGAFQRNAFGALMGNGLLTSEGAFHLAQRKLMASAFQPKNIAGYADLMVADTLRAQQAWKDGEVIDLDQEMMRLSMSIGAKALFDADVFDAASELGAAVATGFQYVDYRASSMTALPLFVPTPRNLRFKKALAVIHRGIQAIIDERRSNPTERKDLLSTLLRARDEGSQGMTDEQLRDETLTLFVGGYETAAKALAWSLYLLASHTEHAAKLRHEVDTVLEGRPPTAADLPRLPYALQIFKEALRLYPPGAAIARQALRDVEIAGYRIPKRQLVMLMVYTVHRRPDIYPDPERFDPERFTPENEKKLPRFAFMPFGAGARICIGNYFALLEGQLTLITLAQRMSFELVPHQVIEPELRLTVRPRYGIKAVVRRRDSQAPHQAARA